MGLELSWACLLFLSLGLVISGELQVASFPSVVISLSDFVISIVMSS